MRMSALYIWWRNRLVCSTGLAISELPKSVSELHIYHSTVPTLTLKPLSAAKIAGPVVHGMNTKSKDPTAPMASEIPPCLGL